MISSDQQTFDQAMDVLSMAFSISRSAFEQRLDVYFDYLADVPLSKVLKAIDDAVRTLDSFPSINKLRSLAHARDDRYDCTECKKKEREQHLVELTQKYYEQCNRDIPWTIERVYEHTQTTFSTDPQVRLWAKRAIAEMEGWPMIGKRHQSRDDRLAVVQALAKRMTTKEMMQCGAIG